MPPSEPLGPFCQSCSMPLGRPEDFGTDGAGYRVNDYCRHCYQGGAFTEPSVTLERMIDRCAGIMAQQGIMTEAKARALLIEVMPRLTRWRESVSHPAFQGAGGSRATAGDEQC